MRYYLVCICIILLAAAMAAQGGPHKPKKVRCKDKKFTNCYKKDLFCPDTCLRDCVVDCVSCQPVCVPPPPSPPPPPPPTRKPKKVRCKDKKFPNCYKKDLYCPNTCPRDCVVDCVSCQPVCIPPPLPYTSPPPPAVHTPPTPPSEASAQKAYCKNKLYPQCYRMEQTCPSSCPQHCEVDCVTCSPVCNCNRPGAVCQDPRFIGADGLTFYFHGKKDRDFCIVSDTNLHINAHFIGRRNDNMKRDFTWVQSLGILFDNHQLFVGAKKTSTWDDAVDRLEMAFDGQPISIPEGEGSKWEPAMVPRISITRSRGTNSVTVEVEGNFQIKATVVPITETESRVHNYGINEDDCFAHLDTSFKFYSLTSSVTGVLGQTYASNYVSRVKMGVDMPVLGGEREFSSSSLFSTDCEAARFGGGFNANASSLESYQHAHLRCTSGVDGGGVVCKK